MLYGTSSKYSFVSLVLVLMRAKEEEISVVLALSSVNTLSVMMTNDSQRKSISWYKSLVEETNWSALVVRRTSVAL